MSEEKPEGLSELDELRWYVKNCIQTPIDELVKNTKWGSIDFEDSRFDLSRLFSIVEPLTDLPIDELPDGIIRTIKSHVANVQNQLEEIRTFSIEDGDALARRDTIVTQLGAHVDALYSQLAPWVPFLAYRRGDIDAQLKKLSSSIDSAKELLDNAEVWVQTQKNKIETIAEAARDAAASAGVAAFTADFSGQAETHGTTAEKWLNATMLLTASTVALAFLFLYKIQLPDDPSTAEAVYYSATKFIVLGLNVAAALWCGQIYRTHKHLEAVNKHKANSLKTFQAFVEATDDAQIKDAVLLEATRSIFTIAKSGFVGADASSSAPSQKVFEIVRGATDGGGGSGG